MKISEGYFLRQVLDMYVVMGTNAKAAMSRVIMSTNETGAFLWNLLEQGAEKAELVEKMTQEFEVEAAAAEKDVEAFLRQLKDKALIEE